MKENEKYVQSQTVLAMIETKAEVYVCYPSKCECGAVTRKLGEPKAGGSYVCPLCGVSLPYAFWSAKTEPKKRSVSADELILGLHENHCPTCGERPTRDDDKCRCGRRRDAEDNEAIREWYKLPLYARDVDTLPQHLRSKFAGWRPSIERAKEDHALRQNGDRGREEFPPGLRDSFGTAEE